MIDPMCEPESPRQWHPQGSGLFRCCRKEAEAPSQAVPTLCYRINRVQGIDRLLLLHRLLFCILVPQQENQVPRKGAR